MQALSLPGESAQGGELESFWKGMARYRLRSSRMVRMRNVSKRGYGFAAT